MTDIHIRPDADDVVAKMPKDAIFLSQGVARARPGDTLVIWPGLYTKPVTITRSGTAAQPITLRGPEDRDVMFDGRQPQDRDIEHGMRPTSAQFAMIKVIGCAHIRLERLRFERCWPSAIFIQDSDNISVSNCGGTGGRFFVYVRSTSFGKSHSLLLEQSDWVQDPNFDMWEGRVTWPQVKAKVGRTDRSFFNGAMFGSHNVAGPIAIRNNSVSHAFNGIRMKIDRNFIEESENGPVIRRNNDVAIYENRFAFIRDNAIEPEFGAENWRVAGNRFFNIHAALSVDGVATRDFYFVGNTILNNRKPGQHGQENRGGKVIKFISPGDENIASRRNFWTLFNSVQSRTTYTKKGETLSWQDYGSAVGIWNKDHPLAGQPRALFEKMTWPGNIRVRYLACNEDGFDSNYKTVGKDKTVFPADISGFPPVSQVFDGPDPGCEPKETLGGWSGELMRSRAVATYACPAITVTGADGSTLDVPDGLAPGAHDLGVLLPDGWLERRWPKTSA